MKLLRYILFLIFSFLGVLSNVSYANTKNCEIPNASYQTDVTPASKTTSKSFFNNKLTTCHITKASSCLVTISVKQGTFPKFNKTSPVFSEETKWLSLFYLDENGKLAFHSKRAVLSQENKKAVKKLNLVEAWKGECYANCVKSLI